jgi:hypothetical protein
MKKAAIAMTTTRTTTPPAIPPTILPVLVLPVDDGEAEALVVGALECCVTNEVEVTGARDGFVWVVEGNTYYFGKIRIKKVVRKRYRTDVVVEEVVTGATLTGRVELVEEVVVLEVVLEVVTDVVVGTAG